MMVAVCDEVRNGGREGRQEGSRLPMDTTPI